MQNTVTKKVNKFCRAKAKQNKLETSKQAKQTK